MVMCNENAVNCSVSKSIRNAFTFISAVRYFSYCVFYFCGWFFTGRAGNVTMHA